MNYDPHFDYLSTAIGVPEPIPADLDGPSFYRNPNASGWSAICRVLIHESLHYWQVYSSGYIANLVANEWVLLQTYEREQRIPPDDLGQIESFGDESNDLPFTARELSECWARFWEVHIRNPVAVIEEENLELLASGIADRQNSLTVGTEYPSTAFDLFMTEGDGKSNYERPYRWALDRAGESHFVAVVFPILVHAAFGTPHPVRAFCTSFDRALASQCLANAPVSGNINFDWLNNWDAVLGEAFAPTRAELSLPAYTSGFDVIRRGPLSSHPVYSEVARYQHRVLTGHTRLNSAQVPEPQGGSAQAVELWAETDLALRDLLAVFGLPGQPNYRFMLGVIFSPPVVTFTDAKLLATRPASALNEVMGQSGSETFDSTLDELATRVRTFRNAQWALDRGLPIDAFEATSS